MELENSIEIIEFKKQIILQGPPGTGKTRLAKELAYQLIFDNNQAGISYDEKTIELNNSDQCSLIQFHPSYTYEDFVRGITVKSNETGLEYETVNRVLLEMAELAQENHSAYINNTPKLTKKEFAEAKVNEYLETIRIERPVGDIPIGEGALIKRIEDDHVIFSHQDYMAKANGFKETIERIVGQAMIALGDDNASGVSLWQKMKIPLKKVIEDLVQDTPDEGFAEDDEKTPLKKYVLIIDEINRANLSSVLGELIYGLEYRGEPINSLYEKNNSTEIVIPPNLYIIGTMNTADRSVGGIDYAIRRRFAFKEVLPDISIIEDDKAQKLFQKVETFFDEGNISSEFEKKDVQLGHSYFLADSDELLRLKLKTEIKPILREYIKDGILLISNKEEIEELNVE